MKGKPLAYYGMVITEQFPTSTLSDIFNEAKYCRCEHMTFSSLMINITKHHAYGYSDMTR
jgi:hypothetical protein